MSNAAENIEAMFVTPVRVSAQGGPRDLADVPTADLEEVQRMYVRRLNISKDPETMSKAQAVGYELGLRIVMAEIRKDLAKLGN